jgi:hypothetical protein
VARPALVVAGPGNGESADGRRVPNVSHPGGVRHLRAGSPRLERDNQKDKKKKKKPKNKKSKKDKIK